MSDLDFGSRLGYSPTSVRLDLQGGPKGVGALGTELANIAEQERNRLHKQQEDVIILRAQNDIRAKIHDIQALGLPPEEETKAIEGFAQGYSGAFKKNPVANETLRGYLASRANPRLLRLKELTAIKADNEALTETLLKRRDDLSDLQQEGADLFDPSSPNFLRFEDSDRDFEEKFIASLTKPGRNGTPSLTPGQIVALIEQARKAREKGRINGLLDFLPAGMTEEQALESLEKGELPISGDQTIKLERTDAASLAGLLAERDVVDSYVSAESKEAYKDILSDVALGNIQKAEKGFRAAIEKGTLTAQMIRAIKSDLNQGKAGGDPVIRDALLAAARDDRNLFEELKAIALNSPDITQAGVLLLDQKSGELATEAEDRLSKADTERTNALAKQLLSKLSDGDIESAEEVFDVIEGDPDASLALRFQLRGAIDRQSESLAETQKTETLEALDVSIHDALKGGDREAALAAVEERYQGGSISAPEADARIKFINSADNLPEEIKSLAHSGVVSVSELREEIREKEVNLSINQQIAAENIAATSNQRARSGDLLSPYNEQLANTYIPRVMAYIDPGDPQRAIIEGDLHLAILKASRIRDNLDQNGDLKEAVIAGVTRRSLYDNNLIRPADDLIINLNTGVGALSADNVAALQREYQEYVESKTADPFKLSPPLWRGIQAGYVGRIATLASDGGDAMTNTEFVALPYDTRAKLLERLLRDNPNAYSELKLYGELRGLAPVQNIAGSEQESSPGADTDLAREFEVEGGGYLFGRPSQGQSFFGGRAPPAFPGGE